MTLDGPGSRDGDLDELVHAALTAGVSVDLDGVRYGRATWGDHRHLVTTAPEYYRFLAGLIRVTGSRFVLECGTHDGGSARAMARALPADGRVLTFDIHRAGARLLRHDRKITARRADVRSPKAWRIARRLLPEGADLAFVDAEHTQVGTDAAVDLAVRCGAGLIVVDDVSLDDEMARCWRGLRRRFGWDRTVDAGALDPAVRGAEGVGLGLIVLADRAWPGRDDGRGG